MALIGLHIFIRHGERKGGDGGGEIVAVGTPETVAKPTQSWTGRFPKPMLERDRARRKA